MLLAKWIKQTILFEEDRPCQVWNPQRILKTYNAIKITALGVSRGQINLRETENFINLDQVFWSQLK